MPRNIYNSLTWIFYALIIILLSITFLVGKTYNIPFEKIMGDPANYYNAHPFTGIISNIGVLMWCTTTSICLFTGIFLLSNGVKKEAFFLIYSGLFSLILLFDDLFMLHDYIFYSFKDFILEPIIFTGYAILLIYYSINYYRIILENNYFVFSLAVLFLGLSILIDSIFPSEGLEHFVEDGLKFIGIANWMLFFTTTSFNILSKKLFIPS